ncbi:hypothetical protein [Halalkalicoccus sp. NIPERK01]|uniref:hypothetical protein n=1 Tax=Halalkalicoccus sp. NIPERK01 TaxID=3053469 RepID=UPI00256F3F46|nr:hypothetical protein [Halalkalicoccus sp. NIPERK01]MDL5363906.1 hypothetical protein [Halalkalicoccus sp. NIPERK01]
MITGDDENSNENRTENTRDTKGSEEATDSPLADEENAERNGTSEGNTDEQADEGGEENTEDKDAGEGGPSRPEDPVDTVTVIDHGLDISPAEDPKVDKEIVCYATFEIGEWDLRKCRVDAVALAENGDHLDQGFVPFFEMNAGETYDVEIPFYIDPDEIHEYLIGMTEAQYAE